MISPHLIRAACSGGAGVPAPDWSIEPGSSLWLRAGLGHASADGAIVSTWTGVNPPAAHPFGDGTGIHSPIYRATGFNGHPGLEFSDDSLSSAIAGTMDVSDMFGAGSSSNPSCVVAIVDIDSVASSAGDYNNDAIWSNNATYCGMYLTNIGGARFLIAHLYNGGVGHVYAFKPIPGALPRKVALSWRYAAGNLYAGVDGEEGAPASASTGIDSGANSQSIQIGTRGTSGSNYLSGLVAEIGAKQDGTFPTSYIDGAIAYYGIPPEPTWTPSGTILHWWDGSGIVNAGSGLVGSITPRVGAAGLIVDAAAKPSISALGSQPAWTCSASYITTGAIAAEVMTSGFIAFIAEPVASTDQSLITAYAAGAVMALNVQTAAAFNAMNLDRTVADTFGATKPAGRLSVLATWSPTQADLYINGVLVASDATAIAVPDPTQYNLGSYSHNAVGSKFGAVVIGQGYLPAGDAVSLEAYAVAKAY